MSGQSTIDSTEMLVWILLIVIGAIVVIPNLIYPNFYIGLWMDFKTAELALITPIFNLVLPDTSVTETLNYFESRLNYLYPTDLNWGSIVEIEQYSLIYRWPVVLPAAYLVWKVLRFKPENTGMLNFDDLIELQTRKHWRFNRHLIKHNPQKDADLDATKGRYAQRQKPIDYCLKHQILSLSHDTTDEEEREFFFYPDVAKQVMSKQLGNVYKRVDSFSRAERWMLAAFLLWLNADNDGYHEFLGDISEAMSHEDDKVEESSLCLVDKYAEEVIDELKEEDELTYTVRTNLGSEVIGTDVAVVVRDLIDSLVEKHDFNIKSIKFLKTYFPDEWRCVESQEEAGVAYYKLTSTPPGYLAIAAAAVYMVDGEEDKAESIISMDVTLDTDEITDYVDDGSRKLSSKLEFSPGNCYRIATQNHNYTRGVLLRLYQMCGDLGVVCASRFTFIMLVDRELYLTLLDEGLPEASIEVSFIRAHFDAEIEAERKLTEPEIDHQITALRGRLLERVDLVSEE